MLGSIAGSVTYSGPAVTRTVVSDKSVLDPASPMPQSPIYSESMIIITGSSIC